MIAARDFPPVLTARSYYICYSPLLAVLTQLERLLAAAADPVARKWTCRVEVRGRGRMRETFVLLKISWYDWEKIRFASGHQYAHFYIARRGIRMDARGRGGRPLCRFVGVVRPGPTARLRAEECGSGLSAVTADQSSIHLTPFSCCRPDMTAQSEQS